MRLSDRDCEKEGGQAPQPVPFSPAAIAKERRQIKWGSASTKC